MFASLLVLLPMMAPARLEDLTNGTLWALPLALYHACTAWLVQSGRMLAAVGASVCLAAAMSANLACILMVPFHIALVALVARKPLSAATIAALAVAATFAIESSTVAAQLARVLLRPTVFVLGLLLVMGVGVAVRKPVRTLIRRIAEGAQEWRHRLLDMPAPVRLRAAMKLAAMYLVTAVWIASTTVRGLRIPDAHYFLPAVVPLAFLAADAAQSMSGRTAAGLIGVLLLSDISLLFAPLACVLGSVLCVVTGAVSFVFLLVHALRSRDGLGSDLEARPSSRVAIAGTMLVCLMSVPDALIYPRTRQVWPVATTEKMVRGLYDSGFTFPQLMGELQGQAPYTIQSMIASLDPNLFRDPVPPSDATLSLLAMIVDPTIAARTHDVVMRLPAPRRQSAVAIRSASVLDRAHLRTCYARSCDEQIDPRRCTTRDPHGMVRHERPYFPVVEVRASDSLFSYQPPGATYCIRFLIPLRVAGTGEPHWLRVTDLWPLDTRIRQVSGVSFEGALPGPEVRLSNDRPGTGTLEVEVSAHGIGPESDWLEQPPLIEVSSANEHLLEPFRHGRVTLR
jgi:hypothetical protein